MDWLNWALRAFTVVGGFFAFICFLVGAYAIYINLRSTVELWQAKRRFYRFQKESADFQNFARYSDPHTNDAQNQKEPPSGRG